MFRICLALIFVLSCVTISNAQCAGGACSMSNGNYSGGNGVHGVPVIRGVRARRQNRRGNGLFGLRCS